MERHRAVKLAFAIFFAFVYCLDSPVSLTEANLSGQASFLVGNGDLAAGEDRRSDFKLSR